MENPQDKPSTGKVRTRRWAWAAIGVIVVVIVGTLLVDGVSMGHKPREFAANVLLRSRTFPAVIEATERGLLADTHVQKIFAGAEGESQGKGGKKEKWEALFNGRDLAGWTVKLVGHDPNEDPKRVFRVEDGVLRVSYDGYEKFEGQFGHLFWREELGHYRLRVEYRFVGEQLAGGPAWAWRNSGVMIHSQSVESMGQAQDFPVSVEVQLLGGGEEGERPTANVCTPGTNIVMEGELVRRHCTNSRSKTYRGDQWVTVEVEVHGSGVIRHWVNGKEVLVYERGQLDEAEAAGRWLIGQRDGEKMLSKGYIALQAESHPVEFRKVELLRLDEPGGR